MRRRTYILVYGAAAVLVLGCVVWHVIDFIAYHSPANQQARRLGNDLNEELAEFLDKDPRFGFAQPFWAARPGWIGIKLYGATDPDKQTIVRDWMNARRAQRKLDVRIRIEFYEDYRKVGFRSAQIVTAIDLE